MQPLEDVPFDGLHRIIHLPHIERDNLMREAVREAVVAKPGAVVGASGFGSYHFRELSKLLDAGNVHIVGTSESSVAATGYKVAQQFSLPLPTAHVGVEKLLQVEPKIKVAIVATPPDTHLEIVRKLLNADVHVLLEKPAVPISFAPAGCSVDSEEYVEHQRAQQQLVEEFSGLYRHLI